jgi:hypothetical protein
MARRHAFIGEENNLRIPGEAFTFEGFQRWVESGAFPENGRIDYLQGDIEVDMSPEDLKLLPPIYAKAGVPEFWIADVRKDKVKFQIHTLEDGKYVAIAPDKGGWMRSPRLDFEFRLTRHRTPMDSWHYVLEHRES